MTSRPISLSASVESFLNKYFDDHGYTLPPAGLYERVLKTMEEPLLRITLERTSGNQQKAALVLGISRNTLRKKLETFSCIIK